MTVGESGGEPHLVINMHRSILPRAGGYRVNCDCSSWLLGFFVTGRRRRPKLGLGARIIPRAQTVTNRP
ncbi:MAG: hypothetical protein DI553_02000 [Cutibacterium acnes]|nr:MAG: hypothetical protein DI553_02000 [Cutibacterium acnes]